jgi:hypothetical protein
MDGAYTLRLLWVTMDNDFLYKTPKELKQMQCSPTTNEFGISTVSTNSGLVLLISNLGGWVDH